MLLKSLFQNVIQPTILGRQRGLSKKAALIIAQYTTSVDRLFKPIAFYSIVPLKEKRTYELRDMIEKNLRQLGVVGRIYLAPESGIGGINCQMAVPFHQVENAKDFFKGLQDDFGHPQFNDGIIDTTTPNFSKLRVALKTNLVAVRQHLTTEQLAAQPDHLTPEQWHTELNSKRENAFLLDMRNQYEYEVGHFDHAIKMDVDTFREGMDLMDELLENKSKKDDIYMYCTGGIRCSVAGAYLKQKGYENVKMLKGGVTAYGHYIRNTPTVASLFKGKNFTFDGRRGEPITQDVLTQCYHCGAACDHITNCSNTRCHLLFIQCEQCKSKMHHTCSDHCQNVLDGKESYTLEYDYHRQVSKAW